MSLDGFIQEDLEKINLLIDLIGCIIIPLYLNNKKHLSKIFKKNIYLSLTKARFCSLRITGRAKTAPKLKKQSYECLKYYTSFKKLIFI